MTCDAFAGETHATSDTFLEASVMGWVFGFSQAPLLAWDLVNTGRRTLALVDFNASKCDSFHCWHVHDMFI